MTSNSESKFLEIFGAIELNKNMLPTHIDIARHFYYLSTANNNNMYPSRRIKCIVDILIEIWSSASIPYFKRHSIYNKVKIYVNMVQNLKKKSNNNESLIYEHNDKYRVLFDICTCTCEVKNRICKCDRYSSIPEVKKEFMRDMRSARVLIINDTRKEDTISKSLTLKNMPNIQHR